MISNDTNKKNTASKYDRVMSQVYKRSRYGLKSPAIVTRHEKPSFRIGDKSSVSNVSSSIFSELPVVLNDYTLELSPQKITKRTSVVKPRKTVTSLDPSLSPHRRVRKVEECNKKSSNLKSRPSATSLQLQPEKNFSDGHFRQCLSSRSHTKLRELKDEIKAYDDTEKLMKLKCSLYTKCGVVFENNGNVAADKAVQVEHFEPDKDPENIRLVNH